MSPRADAALEGRRALVMGLGRFGGGVGVTRWLASRGMHVTVTDLATADSLGESIAELSGLNVSLRLGGHEGIQPSDFDLVVVNPAVVKTRSELFQSMVRQGVLWTTEMNLFCERCPAPVLGVTGSYGKSTTCAMLAHCLEHLRVRQSAPYAAVHLGGNIGRSLLMDLPAIGPTDIVVLEMSNAQLEDLPRIDWTPATAAITNLFPHHLDRYGGLGDYIAAKLNIISRSSPSQPVIAGELHEQAESLLAERLRSDPSRLVRVQRWDGVRLGVRGRHNRRNADCVLTICEALGLDALAAASALEQFRGLPHRLELVRTLNGVDFINDSKSTAPAATVTALQALTDEPDRAAGAQLIAIVGGQDKDVSFAECAEHLARLCRVAICTGDSGPSFAAAIRKAAPSMPCHIAEDLRQAVLLASVEAKPGEVVLFSPGAPSFDRYSNFTERGRHFIELVQSL